MLKCVFVYQKLRPMPHSQLQSAIRFSVRIREPLQLIASLFVRPVLEEFTQCSFARLTLGRTAWFIFRCSGGPETNGKTTETIFFLKKNISNVFYHFSIVAILKNVRIEAKHRRSDVITASASTSFPTIFVSTAITTQAKSQTAKTQANQRLL